MSKNLDNAIRNCDAFGPLSDQIFNEKLELENEYKKKLNELDKKWMKIYKQAEKKGDKQVLSDLRSGLIKTLPTVAYKLGLR